MDTALLLLLLALLNGNDQMKTSLRSLLALYRENRELIAALLQNGAPPNAPPPPNEPPFGPPPHDPPPPPHEPPHKESRPRGGIGTLDILDEYLRRV